MATQTLEQNITGFYQGMHRTNCADVCATSIRGLAARQMLVLPKGNLTLICLAGELWLTRDGDVEDYILGPGQSFTVRPGDQAAVQALRPSRVRLLT